MKKTILALLATLISAYSSPSFAVGYFICSDRLAGYEYMYLQDNSYNYTLYISCDISETDYANLGSPTGTLTNREYYYTEWSDSHSYMSTTWNCSAKTGGYEYAYFRSTDARTSYRSCNTDADGLLFFGDYCNEGDTTITYDGNPGEFKTTTEYYGGLCGGD